jgi:hypothetical protein
LFHVHEAGLGKYYDSLIIKNKYFSLKSLNLKVTCALIYLILLLIIMEMIINCNVLIKGIFIVTIHRLLIETNKGKSKNYFIKLW